MIQPSSRPILLALALTLGACGGGGDDTPTPTTAGGCTYDEYPGTCTGTGDGEFTYTGDVEGTTVTYTGNELASGTELADGASTDCTLSYITGGTCTPCLVDIGDCGSEAFGGIPE